jgi:hypothetical protein
MGIQTAVHHGQSQLTHSSHAQLLHYITGASTSLTVHCSPHVGAHI